MTPKDPDLDTAYALETPDDNRALYAKWATTYDSTFAEAMDFLMPGHVARLFCENGGKGPVLDAGAGTGLVAAALQDTQPLDIDALDLSPEMLAVARSKGLYRNTIVGDLTKPLDLQDGIYNSVVCCGTFTHGHVGPEALDELLRVAAPNGLFVLTIKEEHYNERGFAKKFEGFGDQIADFAIVRLQIYGDAADAAHATDKGLVVTFSKS